MIKPKKMTAVELGRIANAHKEMVKTAYKNATKEGFTGKPGDLIADGVVPSLREFQETFRVFGRSDDADTRRLAIIERCQGSPLRSRLKDKAVAELMLLLKLHARELKELEQELEEEEDGVGIF